MKTTKNLKTEYSFTQKELLEALAEKLGFNVETASIYFKIEELDGDDFYGFKGIDTITEIKVTVNNEISSLEEKKV